MSDVIKVFFCLFVCLLLDDFFYFFQHGGKPIVVLVLNGAVFELNVCASPHSTN